LRIGPTRDWTVAQLSLLYRFTDCSWCCVGRQGKVERREQATACRTRVSTM